MKRHLIQSKYEHILNLNFGILKGFQMLLLH